MKQKAAAVATSIALLASVAVAPVSAQGVQDGTINDGAVNNTVPGTTANEDRSGGFEWWWLLPLLAIPLFFVFRSEDRSDDTREYRDQRLAGTRGGESRRERRERADEYRDEEEVL